MSAKGADVKQKNMNVTEKQVVIIQQEKIKEANAKGYLCVAEDNLIELFENWKEIKEELSNGNGNELESKFCALHSSSALCVNNFAPFKKHKNEISFCEHSKFEIAEFEKKLSTRISTPNLDFYFENQETIIGVESKFTEHLKTNLDHTKKNLCKYYNRTELEYLPKGFMNSIVFHYISSSKKMYLDVAQLIKHSIGLINESKKADKKAILVYIYWQPDNWEDIDVFKQHKKELDDFAERISKFKDAIEFKHLSYIEFWDTYKKDKMFSEHIGRVENRYRFSIEQ